MNNLIAMYRASLAFLEQRIFPGVIWLGIHPYFITLLILLLVPLELDASNTALALALGNLTNVCSAAISCVVLLRAERQTVQRMDQHAALQQRHDEHAALLQSINQQLLNGSAGGTSSVSAEVSSESVMDRPGNS